MPWLHPTTERPITEKLESAFLRLLNAVGRLTVSGSWSACFKRIAAFVAVGLVSCVSYVTTLEVRVDQLGWSVSVSAFLAFLVATCFSYLGNTLLTFRARLSRRTLWRFLAVVLTGMITNQAIAGGLDALGAHYLFIALAVFITVPWLNFIGHLIFTYREGPL